MGGCLDASCAKLPRIMILKRYFFYFSLCFFVFFFLLNKCYLLFVVTAFRLAHRQAGSGMSSTAFADAVDCASMMTEMLLLLLLLEVVVVVEEEMMVVMVVVTVVAVEVVPVGGVYLLTITLEG